MKNVEKSKILEYITTVAVPFVSEFVAKKHFRVNACFDFEDNEPIVAIASLETPNNHGKYFKPNFLDKIERNVPARRVKVQRLVKSARDYKILEELDKIASGQTIALAHFYEILKLDTVLKKRGSKKGLLINAAGSYSVGNIAYINDVRNKMWCVHALYDLVLPSNEYGGSPAGWDIDAFPIDKEENPPNCWWSPHFEGHFIISYA